MALCSDHSRQRLASACVQSLSSAHVAAATKAKANASRTAMVLVIPNMIYMHAWAPCKRQSTNVNKRSSSVTVRDMDCMHAGCRYSCACDKRRETTKNKTKCVGASCAAACRQLQCQQRSCLVFADTLAPVKGSLLGRTAGVTRGEGLSKAGERSGASAGFIRNLW